MHNICTPPSLPPFPYSPPPSLPSPPFPSSLPPFFPLPPSLLPFPYSPPPSLPSLPLLSPSLLPPSFPPSLRPSLPSFPPSLPPLPPSPLSLPPLPPSLRTSLPPLPPSLPPLPPALLLAYIGGSTVLCDALIKAGAHPGIPNKQGLSIFNSPVATKQLLFRILDQIHTEPTWLEGNFCYNCNMKFNISHRKHHW